MSLPPVRTTSSEKPSSIWSVIVHAQGTGREAQDALGRLIRRYEGLVVAMIRAFPPPRGYVAEDLKQDFFLQVLRRGDVHKLDRSAGRFRSWLHAAVRNFMLNVWEHWRAIRSGESCTAPMTFDLQHGVDPELLFMRRFAQATVAYALERQRAKARDKVRFDRWLRFLPGPQLDPTELAGEAEALGMSRNHVAVQLFQLRDKFRSVLREIVADTLAVDAACPQGALLIDAELGALYRLLTELPIAEVVLEEA